jgi:small subunit ribosomal protein S9
MNTKTDTNEYLNAIGRRKTAIASVRLYPASKMSFVINNKELEEYFKTKELQRVVAEAFVKSKTEGVYKISAMVKGGGISAQAEAVRHGISRALIEADPELRKKLKKAGFLKRDSRSKERRKFGLKKARKAPQWSKR